MMKRLFWLGAGLVAGAVVVRVVTKKAQSYTPRGIAAAARDSGRNALDSMRDFVDDVRDGMHEREEELHTAFLTGAGGTGGREGADGFEGVGDTGEFEADFESALDELDAAFGDRPERHPTEGTTR